MYKHFVFGIKMMVFVQVLDLGLDLAKYQKYRISPSLFCNVCIYFLTFFAAAIDLLPNSPSTVSPTAFWKFLTAATVFVR